MQQSNQLDRDIIEFSTLETDCVYQENKKMKMEYKYIKNPPLDLNSKLIRHGWRRFGNYFSRPTCIGCRDCVSVRIDVDNYTLSKSAKRVYKKNQKAGTKVLVRTPVVTQTHLDLYLKYHKYMEQKKGWEFHNISASSYEDLYVEGHGFYGKEVLYFINGELVGVDFIDFLEDGISSIYFFYDPDFSYLSLGRYSLFKQIEFAKKLNLKWIYLGYAVKRCNSLSYKFEYQPQQRLVTHLNIDEEAIWI